MPTLWQLDADKIMNRQELRFRILFIYYEKNHSKDSYDEEAKVREIDAPRHEKRAAKGWLIDSLFVEGVNTSTRAVTLSSISRINARGINYVEFLMDQAFAQMGGKEGAKDLDGLGKTDKIIKFAETCINSNGTGKMCKEVLDLVQKTMLETGNWQKLYP